MMLLECGCTGKLIQEPTMKDDPPVVMWLACGVVVLSWQGFYNKARDLSFLVCSLSFAITGSTLQTTLALQTPCYYGQPDVTDRGYI